MRAPQALCAYASAGMGFIVKHSLIFGPHRGRGRYYKALKRQQSYIIAKLRILKAWAP
jgi:hypothetical protein